MLEFAVIHLAGFIASGFIYSLALKEYVKKGTSTKAELETMVWGLLCLAAVWEIGLPFAIVLNFLASSAKKKD
jgi:hypothetical protein